MSLCARFSRAVLKFLCNVSSFPSKQHAKSRVLVLERQFVLNLSGAFRLSPHRHPLTPVSSQIPTHTPPLPHCRSPCGHVRTWWCVYADKRSCFCSVSVQPFYIFASKTTECEFLRRARLSAGTALWSHVRCPGCCCGGPWRGVLIT